MILIMTRLDYLIHQMINEIEKDLDELNVNWHKLPAIEKQVFRTKWFNMAKPKIDEAIRLCAELFKDDATTEALYDLLYAPGAGEAALEVFGNLYKRLKDIDT